MIRGAWYSVDRCINCNAEMSSNDKMYSNATCPYCGHTDGCTVCSTFKEVRRDIYKTFWHKLFNRRWGIEVRDSGIPISVKRTGEEIE